MTLVCILVAVLLLLAVYVVCVAASLTVAAFLLVTLHRTYADYLIRHLSSDEKPLERK